jgi:HK97 gp10 family phage protein
MDFTIDLHNSKQLKRIFQKAPALARKEYTKSLERIALFVTQEAQHNAPVGKYEGGGNLRQSIRYRPHGNNAYLVTVNANYGRHVEFGTKPHVILPKTKSYLAFKVNGQWVRTKRVNHPGTRAQPFFGPAVQEANKYAGREMDKAMDRVIRGM